MNRNRAPLFFIAICLGCGSAEKVSITDTPRSVHAPRPASRDGFTLETELDATFPIGEVDRVFHANMKKLYKCYEGGLEDLEDIEGAVEFDIQVGDGDEVTDVFVRRSDLGSIGVEQCMVRKISHFTFRRQGDGMATASKTLDLEAPYDHPAPIQFDDAVINTVILAHQGEVDACLKGVTGIQLTLWVGKGGMVLDSGMATETSAQVEAGTCLAKTVKTWAFPDPGKDLAKVHISF